MGRREGQLSILVRLQLSLGLFLSRIMVAGVSRRTCAHGWLWLTEESDAQEFFTDHARLGCAFLTFVALKGIVTMKNSEAPGKGAKGR